ncbi:MAG: hypothetical protein FVQ85_11495 [Planctomycetes bacterium]|nr:hypothetical protein [Planctomycetota bacterium]
MFKVSQNKTGFVGFVVVVVVAAACSSANGATWQAMDSGTTEGLTDVWGTASDDMFAVGYSGTILHYDGDGNNDGNPDDIWEQMAYPTTVSLMGIWGFGPDDVYVTGDQVTMLHYDGNSWTPVPGIPTSGIYILGDTWGSGPNNIFVTAEGYDSTIGHIIHWDGSSGSDITFSFPLTAGALFEVWGLAADDVYVSGYNGYSGGTTGLMYHYNGSTWELFHPDGLGDHDLPKTRAIGGIWNNSGSPDELFLAAQSYGSGPSSWFAEVLYYDGNDWQTRIFSEYPQSHGATDVWGSTLDDVYVTCDAGLILHGNSNFEWSVMDSGTTENLNGIWGNGLGDVFAVGSNGIILRLSEPAMVYHVDGATGDNTNDGLTRETAFATIQRGINAAQDGDTVLVWPGVYNETATNGINFKGKAITVKSVADAAVLEVPGFVAVTFIQGEDGNSVFSNFVLRGSTAGIFALFANPTLNNVTVVGNNNGVIADNANPLITNSIFWNNTNGDLFGSPDPITAQHSWVEDEQADPNLFAYGPLFADANNDDYHLLSERGRYRATTDEWILDDVTSPCVDGGDPNIEPTEERMPNGGRINMGAYGNTAYASMSEWPIKGDVDRNGRFNFVDIALQLDEWLAELGWAQ